MVINITGCSEGMGRIIVVFSMGQAKDTQESAALHMREGGKEGEGGR